MTEQGLVPARVPLRRLRRRARPRRVGLVDILSRTVLAAICATLAVGAFGALGRLLPKAGWAVHGAPGYLFAVAAGLLLLGGLARLLRSAGPVAVSPALWFWLLSAPVRRRDLLRRRYLTLVAAVAVVASVAVGLVAFTGSVATGPVVAMPVILAAGLAAAALVGGAVCGQAWEGADRVIHVLGQALRTAGVVAFGSLATGVGRMDLNSALRAPFDGGLPDALAIGLAALAVIALACCFLGYRALDAIDAGALRRGRGLWTAGQAAAVSMDAFVLADFLTDQRARETARVRPARIGPRPGAGVGPARPRTGFPDNSNKRGRGKEVRPARMGASPAPRVRPARAGFAGGLARSEWARLRRRPELGVRLAGAAVVCWGCAAVLPGPALAAVALIVGYFLVLPAAGTLRQLTAHPSLREQFAPRDRWLSRASIAVCLLASALWAAIITPALATTGGIALAALIAIGLTAAVCRTVTRPPLNYLGPLVPTPAGDLPLDLWRQLARGPLLLAVVITAAIVLIGR